MSIFAQIENLAHEQQYLWQEARHKRVNSDKRQRLTAIKTELAHLWHLYRCEMAEERRKQWRQESKLRGINPDVLHWVPGDLDSFSAGDMQSILRIEYQRLKRRGFSSLDEKWSSARQSINHSVNLEAQVETRMNRRTQKVVADLVHSPAADKPAPFNPHEMSLRQLRQHRQQPHDKFSLAGAL